MSVNQWIIDKAVAGEVVANVGQVDPATKRALEKLVKAGTLKKWRGHWFPQAGAPYGIGPLKTCYGRPEWHAYFFGSQQAA